MTALGRISGIGAVAVLLAAALTSSCSTGSDGAQGFVPAAQSHRAAAARVHPYENLSELLDNTQYTVGGRPPHPATVAVVTGRFLGLAPGRAFTVEGDDAPDGTEIGFDGPDALWRTMHAKFAVDQIISGRVSGQEVTVGLAFPAQSDLDPIRKDLLDLGPVALFLDRSPVFGYDATLYSVVLDGGLIAPIDVMGGLSLPALAPSEAEKLLRESRSVEALKAKARGPHTVIELDATGTQRLPQ
ncbi:hypothetical protein [Knoellia sp. p5-6-4]|uniref:hypothetical protein n=1 Tax=unclassified Knoellia TaxID=2618719 RepID=UPI0023DA723F|nr:hypothetical protein [Knoellia sp. p5-6-4]MDF2146875.1 hypothetical protein [Knoellia sp. p5-6-4]